MDIYPHLGASLVEPTLLRTFETLWEGSLKPESLADIERCLRAFLVSPRLMVGRVDVSTLDELSHRADPNCFEEPFGDHLLDYEFEHPANPQPFKRLEEEENHFLRDLIYMEALTALPAWISTQGEALAYWHAWFDGAEQDACVTAALNQRPELEHYHALFPEKFRGRDSIVLFRSVRPELWAHATYLVASHRAGMLLFGCSPIARLCAKHLFSAWPEKLFEKFGEQFRMSAEALRGPGTGLNLPPLISLVLSRADKRYDIPTAILELREEYRASRNQLWEILHEMWFAPTFSGQMKVLRKLESASESIFESAFPDATDGISLGITAVRVVTGDLAAGLERLQEKDQARSRIAAVSFARKLSDSLRKDLLTQTTLLRRHLSKAELHAFGQA